MRSTLRTEVVALDCAENLYPWDWYRSHPPTAQPGNNLNRQTEPGCTMPADRQSKIRADHDQPQRQLWPKCPACALLTRLMPLREPKDNLNTGITISFIGFDLL